MSDRIIIRARGDYYAPVAGEPPDVRELSKQTLGKQVRRVGRFIQLALIGAARCVGTETPPAHTAIYMSSRRGDLETNIEVLQQLFAHGQSPKPLSFINTVSNASCYYVARHFGLHGRSCFVAGVCFSFEMALQTALLDFEAGMVRSALIGGLDTAVAPLSIDRRRLGVAEDAPVGEASHWLWLESRPPAPGDVTLEAAEALADRAALTAWLRGRGLNPAHTLFAAGQFLAPADAAAIAREAGLTRTFSYRDGLAYYDGQAGAALGAFMAAPGQAGCVLAHVNGDAEGRYAVFVARKIG
jgi:hypothetical protein